MDLPWSNEALSFSHFSCRSSSQALRGTLAMGPHGCMFGEIANVSCNLLWFLFYSKYLLLNILCIGNFIFFYGSLPLMAHYYQVMVLCSPLQGRYYPSSVSCHPPAPATLSLGASALSGTFLTPDDRPPTGNVFPRKTPSVGQASSPSSTLEKVVNLGELNFQTLRSPLPALPSHLCPPFSCSARPF